MDPDTGRDVGGVWRGESHGGHLGQRQGVGDVGVVLVPLQGQVCQRAVDDGDVVLTGDILAEGEEHDWQVKEGASGLLYRTCASLRSPAFVCPCGGRFCALLPPARPLEVGGEEAGAVQQQWRLGQL